jgi:hypothetical protein
VRTFCKKAGSSCKKAGSWFWKKEEIEKNNKLLLKLKNLF